MHHRTGNDLWSENTKFYGDRVFCFPGGAFSEAFLNFMKASPNLIKVTLREIHDIQGQKFVKLQEKVT